MSEDESRYAHRGVSSLKRDVHRAIAKLDQGLFPGAFCKILPDHLGSDPLYCNIQHADGAGTKSSLAYLVWKLTGNLDVWRGIAQDSLVMNLDDIGCIGNTGPFLISSIIGRNKALIPGEILKALIEGSQEFCDLLSDLGIPCHFSGGETADIGDLNRTITVDNVITARMRRADVIDASKIKAPALIVGFSSTGQARWEKEPNSGIGSNGLTNARHDVLAPFYRTHKETYAPETNPKLIYCGKYTLDEPLPGDERFTIKSALLSSTRIYLPLLTELLDCVGGRDYLLGIIHCSGGGQTKIGKFGGSGIIYRKNNLFPIPPLFRVLQNVRNLTWYEMYSSYSMGHRLEVVVPSHNLADECIDVARECNIDAQVIGEVIPNPENQSGREVLIQSSEGEFSYKF